MPARTDLRSILILGSGPIVIGQACEFDYSGAQACKALREEGYRVILANSNPATIMTDPEFADRTYVEPLTPETLERILEIERPDAVLPTLGGQTALNLAAQLSDRGVLKRLGIALLGATREVIHKAEDREAFKKAMLKIGLDVPRSELARTPEEAEAAVGAIGLPCVIRPAYTLGGIGGGIAYNLEEARAIARRGLSLSMVGEILVEESVVGWKEFELEVMRDRNDNAVIVCSIENFDPMGIHTGDSITVAPAQTLTDKEYQRMRDAALAIMSEIGVETGGSNIQFALEPSTGRMIVIEMNPRVSRSSALASKATGFPIAKIAAKLAVGYTLDELRNDITRETPASFEPTIDYCVVKIPRWAFEKFPSADRTLGTAMKSVGEVMAIGRSFPEAFQKALRGLEIGRDALVLHRPPRHPQVAPTRKDLQERLAWPHPERIFAIAEALRDGMTVEEVHARTKVDPWFLSHLTRILGEEDTIRKIGTLPAASPSALRDAKRLGFSDGQLARAWNSDPRAVRAARVKAGVRATFKRVDTCAAEFEAHTPYCYSTYESECEARPSEKPTIVILGGGPNRIGQGIEFDYCCVHAAFTLKELGYHTVMINSNPETVSTDYDTSDQLYFEPLTVEDVLNVCEALSPVGLIVQYGGQTPLNLARGLQAAGQKILGTSVEEIDLASSREKFSLVLKELGLRQPANGSANNFEEALAVAEEIGYPVVVRPSYVLGGRAMEIVFDRTELERYMRLAVEASPERPVLVDRFIEDATEVDVDAVADGKTCRVGGIMEHVEEAGVHSGDSCCVLPPPTLPVAIVEEIRRSTYALAARLGVKGLMNIQFAIRGDRLYVLEVNPRASRTVPFVSKATGVPLAKIAARVMAGLTLEEAGFPAEEPWPAYYSVKEPVFPFARFPGCDVLLGPEMRSTGEVMGVDVDLGRALAKAKLGAGQNLPREGRIFLSVKDADKREAYSIARQLHEMGYVLAATGGTHRVLTANGIPAERVHKLHEGRPHVLDLVKNRQINLIINTPSGRDPKADEAVIRAHAVDYGIPLITNIHAAAAAVDGMEALRRGELRPVALQDLYAPPRGVPPRVGAATPSAAR